MLPALDDLQRRYATACDLRQRVDRDAITDALTRWAREIGAPAETRVRFVSTLKKAAWAARDARDAGDARAAWDAWDAWAARDARDARDAGAASVARDARDARAARDARDAGDAGAAWAASWEVSWIAIVAIGAVSLGDEKTARIWLPVLEAFEAGAFVFWVADAEIIVSTLPSVVATDDERRLHCETGPAFVWMDDVRDYYWHGTHVPGGWIEQRANLSADTVLRTENIEQRRAGCEIIGWDRILSELSARELDRDDPEIGTLYACDLPGEPGQSIRAHFLRVRCGTGRQFAVCVPPSCGSAIEAQAWMQGRTPNDFLPPEIRT